MRVKLKPWRTAAECIDWSVPCPSIFDRKKSLAENTLRRVARGTMRYVVNNPTPFIVPITHVGDDRVHSLDEPVRTITTANGGEFMLATPFVTKFGTGKTGQSLDEPLATITANSFIKRPGGAPPMGIVAPHLVSVAHGDSGGRREYPIDDPLHTIQANGRAHAVIAPSLIQTSYGERGGQAPRILDLHQPLGTVVAGGIKHSLVASFLAQFNTNPDGSVNAGHSLQQPVSTIATVGPHQALTAAHLISFKGSDRRGGPIDAPAPTITAGGWHVGAVAAFLLSYYGASEEAVGVDGPLHTVTTRDRFGLVLVKIGGIDYVIVDIGMRMLTPRELFTAQGFSPSYKIHTGWGPTKKALTKSDQIRMVGNSVSPPVAIAIAKANAPLMSRLRTPAEAAVA